MPNYTKIDELTLRAVYLIESEHNKSMKPYSKTITSFLIGSRTSPFYSFFRKHMKVCGQMKGTTEYLVINSLDRLVNKGYLKKELTKSGKYSYKLTTLGRLEFEVPVAKERVRKPRQSTTKKEKVDRPQVPFSESCNAEEKSILEKFKSLIEELLPDHLLKEKSLTYGFYPANYEGEFPRNRCWITRDKDLRCLVLKYKVEINDTEKVLRLRTNSEVDYAFNQLRKIYGFDAFF